MLDAHFRFCKSLASKMTSSQFDPNSPGLTGPNQVLVVKVVIGTAVELSADGDQVVGVVGTTAGPSGEAYEFQFNEVTVTEQGIAGVLPLEEAIRPPWVSDEYSNANIGELYQDLLGCGSIFDITNTAASTVVIAGAKVPETTPSVANAVENLVQSYSSRSSGGYLGAEFIIEKTRRGGATLGQVLGPNGFFSQAFGDVDDLSGDAFQWLTTGEATTALNPSEPQSISTELDARKGRYRAAKAYQAELLRQRGFRG